MSAFLFLNHYKLSCYLLTKVVVTISKYIVKKVLKMLITFCIIKK